MLYDIYYTIEARDDNNNSNKLEFNVITDEEYTIETYVINPLTNQYCNSIKQARQGWTEMNEIENKLLDVIEEFTFSADCDIVYEFTTKDINKEYKFKYDKYNIFVKCTDVLETIPLNP